MLDLHVIFQVEDHVSHMQLDVGGGKTSFHSDMRISSNICAIAEGELMRGKGEGGALVPNTDDPRV